MKYKNREISSLTLEELQTVDLDLASKEAAFNLSLQNASERIRKLKPQPQLGEPFVKLRQEIKKEMEKKNG